MGMGLGILMIKTMLIEQKGRRQSCQIMNSFSFYNN
jgi:hypothetical protein